MHANDNYNISWTSVNCIFWNNAADIGPLFYAAPGSSITKDIKYSDIQSNDFISGTSNISIEPRFISTNESNANFLKLASGSPCIDAGIMESGVPTLDLAGNKRPHNWLADMGAYEFQGPSIRVIQPNGGEHYTVGQNISIIWTATDEYGLRASPLPMYVRFSTTGGAGWTSITTEAANTGIYTWEAPPMISSNYLISIEVYNSSGESNYDTSDTTFEVSGTMYPATNLTAEALPITLPTYVSLYWSASTAEVLQGYYIYRGTTPGSYPTQLNLVPTTELTYIDSTVSSSNDYYYAVKAYGWGSYSPYSNMASAPQMKMTRDSTVESPVSGGYSGDIHDSVPGATIKYTVLYQNIGFAPSINIVIKDKVPNYTNYLLGSATGEGAINIRFSSDNGSTYVYSPTGTMVDPLVTNISWEVQNVNAGISKVATYEVVIR